MKTVALAFRYLWARPLAAALNLLLLTLGLASMTFLLLVGHQLDRAFERDLAGIDVVVGAKGSPLQLILAGVLHMDVPPGNVPLKAVEVLKTHPQVAKVIPISLGDSFRQMIEVADRDPKSLILLTADMARSNPPMKPPFISEIAPAPAGPEPGLGVTADLD